MSLAEIEAELENLTAEELRELALKSWTAYREKGGCGELGDECDETDQHLLAALDKAVAYANAHPTQGFSSAEVRARLSQWTLE